MTGWSIKYDKEDQLEEGTFIMEVSPNVADQIIELFQLELDLLNGTTEGMEDGRLRITFTMLSKEKSNLIKEFLFSVIQDQNVN